MQTVETTTSSPNSTNAVLVAGFSEDDYYDRLYKSKHGLIYKQCKGCKTKLGITTDIRGDVHVWLKEDERKDGSIA